MHAGDLTNEQLEALLVKIRPMSHYLFELQNRMDAVEFGKADELYWKVANARYAVLILQEHIHKLRCGPSCPGGK